KKQKTDTVFRWDGMNKKKGMQKYCIYFFRNINVTFINADSKILERIAMLIPIIAVTIFWLWVNYGEKNREK
ncbi:MAG: hypothetical protein ABS938_16745, partial [Psychrobacillus psychrodurans]